MICVKNFDTNRAKISCNEVQVAIKCLIDSGAEVSVLKPRMLPVHIMDSDSAPVIKLRGPFGKRIDVRLLHVSVI
jgi:hypothetical protein